MNIKLKEPQRDFLHMVKAGQVFRIDHSVCMMIVADPKVFTVTLTPPFIPVIDLATGEMELFHRDKLVDLVDGQFVEGA